MKIKKMTPIEIKMKFDKLGGSIPHSSNIQVAQGKKDFILYDPELQIMVAFLKGYSIAKKKYKKKNKDKDMTICELKSQLSEKIRIIDTLRNTLRTQIRNQNDIIARTGLPSKPLHEEALRPEGK